MVTIRSFVYPSGKSGAVLTERSLAPPTSYLLRSTCCSKSDALEGEELVSRAADFCGLGFATALPSVGLATTALGLSGFFLAFRRPKTWISCSFRMDFQPAIPSRRARASSFFLEHPESCSVVIGGVSVARRGLKRVLNGPSWPTV